MDVAGFLGGQTGLVGLDDEDLLAGLLQGRGDDGRRYSLAGIGVSSGDDDDSVQIGDLHDSSNDVCVS